VDKPNGTATLTFQGTAGQRVFAAYTSPT